MAFVYRYNNDFPEWSKVHSFEVHTLHEGDTMDLSSPWRDTAVFVERGRLYITADGKEIMMQAGQAPSNGQVFQTQNLTATTRSFAGYWMDRCTFYVLHGEWNEAEIRTFVINRCDLSRIPELPAYRKNTLYPSQTLSYERVMLLLSGHANLQIGEETEEMAPGDLAFIPANVFHDLAEAHEFCNGVWFNLK